MKKGKTEGQLGDFPHVLVCLLQQEDSVNNVAQGGVFPTDSSPQLHDGAALLSVYPMQNRFLISSFLSLSKGYS